MGGNTTAASWVNVVVVSLSWLGNELGLLNPVFLAPVSPPPLPHAIVRIQRAAVLALSQLHADGPSPLPTPVCELARHPRTSLGLASTTIAVATQSPGLDFRTQVVARSDVLKVATAQFRKIPVDQQGDGWSCGHICAWWRLDWSTATTWGSRAQYFTDWRSSTKSSGVGCPSPPVSVHPGLAANLQE